MRFGEENHKEVLYNPKIVDKISEDENYDLINVTVKANQLISIFPIILKIDDKSDILILKNIWIYNIKEIEPYLIEFKVFSTTTYYGWRKRRKLYLLYNIRSEKCIYNSWTKTWENNR
ncbi:2-dehydropantoate 2-reductase [Clostridium sp. Marseille-Q2269]|uniref:2-dehydropantoate 2-reductase n=1 Tax=Clostridium sp. Marseille-Q2269 TaxID=2942205 RepID=UPI00207466F9|nr:2-dehydropantoate 2-reductase [Clostridium sp. Marseille-Q2269]